MKLEGKTVFPIGAFSAPQPPITKDGKEYPNKITEEQYRLLAESGVNLVYAHNEVMGTETEHYAFEALDFAEKAGVKYQSFFNRSDVRSGGTLGVISQSRMSMLCADLGLAQLAMHSACECFATADYEEITNGLTAFYSSDISIKDGTANVR